MSSPGRPLRWLSKPIVVALHEESTARFGGSPGVRDDGLLEVCSLNGVRFSPAQTDEVQVFTALVAGDLTEAQLGNWIAENSTVDIR